MLIFIGCRFFKDCVREHGIMMRAHKFLSCHGKKTDISGKRLFCSNQEQRFTVHLYDFC